MEHEPQPEKSHRELRVSVAATLAKRKGPLTRGVLDRLGRDAARAKNVVRAVPLAIVVEVQINGNAARALVDSGSLSDFISTKLADQLSRILLNLLLFNLQPSVREPWSTM